MDRKLLEQAALNSHAISELPTEREVALSKAISLKRIADALDRIANAPGDDFARRMGV